VLVAAGSYAEDVAVVDKPVEIRGRCPSMVEIAGTDASTAALVVGAGATTAEIRGVAISGPAAAVQVAALDVELTQVWVHHTGGHGVRLIGQDSTLTLRESLVELTVDRGLYVEGGHAAVLDTVVRDVAVLAAEGIDSGRCINVREDLATGGRGMLTLRYSLIERCHNAGVLIHDSDGVVESTLIRDVHPGAEDRFGRGLQVQAWPLLGHEAATLELRRSVIEGTHDGGVIISAAHATIEHTVVRNIAAAADTADRGYGIAVQSDGPGIRASLVLTASLVDRTHETGLLVAMADAQVESTLIRDTLPLADGSAGRGIDVEPDRQTGQASQLDLRFSEVAGSHEAGVFISGSVATIEGTLIRDTAPRARDGWMGRGLVLQPNHGTWHGAELDMRSSTVRRSGDVAVSLQAARASIQGLLVEDSLGDDSGAGGVGLGAQCTTSGDPSVLQLEGSRFERSGAMGIAVYGSFAELHRVLVRQVASQRMDGLYGDGLAVLAHTQGADVVMTESVIESCERAGISNFGANTAIGTVHLECNGIDMAAQEYEGEMPSYQDLTDNRCGCGTAEQACRVLSTALAPPEPVTDI
jgi:hypothetical protein